MIQDKTYKVKVWDHNDAVITVYERHYKKKAHPKDPDKEIYWAELKPITVIPVDHACTLSDDAFIELVNNTVKALSALYEHTPDFEVGISCTFNYPYVSC
jgi:hypothetical protein